MLARHMSTFNNLTLTTACASSSPTYCFVFYTPISLLPVLCIGHLITPLPKTYLFPILQLICDLPWTPFWALHTSWPLDHATSLLSPSPLPYSWWLTMDLLPSSAYILATHSFTSPWPPPGPGIHLGYFYLSPPPPQPYPWWLTMDSLLSSAYILATRSWSIWWSLGCTLFLQ